MPTDHIEVEIMLAVCSIAMQANGKFNNASLLEGEYIPCVALTML